MNNPSQIKKAQADAEIIALVLAGKIEAYSELVRRYDGYLYKVGRSYGLPHAEIEDLMQEAFVNAYENLAKFEHRSSFKTWIVRIMLNQCYHRTRRAAYQREQSLDGNGSESIFENTNNATRQMVQNDELKDILEQAILSIPEKYRHVFTLRELSDMSVRDTAEALDISEGNVKVRLNRAKTMLQDEIKKWYSPAEIFEFNLVYCEPLVERVMTAVRELEDKRLRD